MPEFPRLKRVAQCPAAIPVAGVSDSQQGVICRLMQRDQDDDPGLRMTAGQHGILRETAGGVYLNLKSDPSTVTGFCHGRAIPRSTEADEGPRAHFTFCPVFEAELEREAAGRDRLTADPEPESVAMGVEPDEFADPWVQARADLDVLAPEVN